jgi:hypothetical protein
MVIIKFAQQLSGQILSDEFNGNIVGSFVDKVNERQRINRRVQIGFPIHGAHVRNYFLLICVQFHS